MWQSQKKLRLGDFIPYLVEAQEHVPSGHKVSRWGNMMKLLCSEVPLNQNRVFDKTFKPIVWVSVTSLCSFLACYFFTREADFSIVE